MASLYIVTLVFILPSTAYPQPGGNAGIYIILDGSGSMWQRLSDQSLKIETAREVLHSFLQRDFSGYDVAMRAYGHRRKGDCEDTELVVPFQASEAAAGAISTFIATVNPTGKTPITRSFREALKDFGDRPGEIILISDGIETCNDDPCALMREWREKQVAIRVHVVGLGLDEKAQNSMKCIADAAGSEYLDARSAGQLRESLRKIHEQSISAGFKIFGSTADGKEMRIDGELWQDGKKAYTVQSYNRHQVEAGYYLMRAGVLTRNGTLYRPVEQRVTVSETGENRVSLVVEEPPSVAVQFLDNDKSYPASGIVYAYRDGKELFRFRAIDRVYLEKGQYEFHSRINQENDLTVSESFAAADRKTIVFQLKHTVRVTFAVYPAGSGEQIRNNVELWQNGERQYRVHLSNGARVLPGIYDLKMPDELTHFEKEGVVITDTAVQHYDFQAPMGYTTVIYQKKDGSRDVDKRCFVGRETEQKSHYRSSGQRFPLPPGSYYVVGWKGDYDRAVFTITAREEKIIYLRAK